MDCRLDLTSLEIASDLGAEAGQDTWTGGPIIEGAFAPVVVRAGSHSRKLIRPMHWGYPAPGQSTELAMPGTMRWVSHVRNLESPFWIGNLRHVELRCLIPLSSFTLSIGKARNLHCRIAGRKLFAVAGIWRDLTDMPVFAMLTTEPCLAALPVEGRPRPKSMPALLDEVGQDQWLSADWNRAAALIQPYEKADLLIQELAQ